MKTATLIPMARFRPEMRWKLNERAAARGIPIAADYYGRRIWLAAAAFCALMLGGLTLWSLVPRAAHRPNFPLPRVIEPVHSAPLFRPLRAPPDSPEMRADPVAGPADAPLPVREAATPTPVTAVMQSCLPHWPTTAPNPSAPMRDGFAPFMA
jgi:hypothetical protein